MEHSSSSQLMKDKNIPTTTVESTISDPTTSSNSPSVNPNNTTKKKKKKNKRVSTATTSSCSADSSATSQQHKGGGGGGFRVMNLGHKWKIRKLPLSESSEFDALALPLGMSIAAFVAQVLDRNGEAVDRISTDHLSLICTSAVKETLVNVFGDRFDHFVKNFGESFGCTLKTLRLVKEVSVSNGDSLSQSSIKFIPSEASRSRYADEDRHSGSSSVLESSASLSTFFDGHRNDPCRNALKASLQIPSVPGICKSHDSVEEIQESLISDSMNQELTLHGEINQQLACFTSRKLGSGFNGSVLNTYEKSVMEQARSNDLKTFEIGLRMKQLQLEESQLALSSDSNRLERFKLSMGISKASFRADKFKTQLEETKHGELLKKCIDCLVAGLFVMPMFTVYGAYVYSFDRISEVTTSCVSPSPKESKSWWMPKQVASINSGWHTVICYLTVGSRMLFGVFMILAIAYLLLQRSTSRQMMPVTHIVFLLGFICALPGKLCVDTLGGDGYIWLLYWETICLLHFIVNICTATIFMILHGVVYVTQGFESKPRLPYWIRRVVFYTLILGLPILCGLMPFAGPSDWKNHFVSLATNAFIVGVGM